MRHRRWLLTREVSTLHKSGGFKSGGFKGEVLMASYRGLELTQWVVGGLGLLKWVAMLFGFGVVLAD